MSSKISRAEPSPKVPATQKQPAAAKLATTQNSYDKTDDLEDVSQMRRNFNDAFEETEISAPVQNDRMAQLEE